MELDENNEVEEQQEGEPVEIYSRRSIFWFFVLLGPLFGGILLMLNLRAVGLKRAANGVFLFVLLFDIASELLLVNYVRYYNIDLVAYQSKLFSYKADANVFDEKITILLGIIIVLKVIGGLILTRYFFRKYFPDNDYYPKSIANTLFVCIFAFILLSLVGLGGI